ncbi:hypothetical protein [Pseudoalteromonas galatheae]
MKLRLMASDKVCDGKIVERQQSIYLKYKKRLKIQAFCGLT